VALNLHEIEVIRAQASDVPCFELQSARSGLSSDDVLELLDYKKLYELIDKRIPKDENIILELMMEYGFVAKASDGFSITNVGAILLANKLSDFDNLKTRQVVIRKYDGPNNRVLSVEKRSLSGNDVQRLIDLPPKSRNEKLAESLFLFDICERRGSGYDRAVEAIEKMKLPPYKTESGMDFTRVTMFPWKKITEMNKVERVQACYQHVCLMFEDGKPVNNGSIRERFGLDKNKAAIASHIISDTMDAGLIKVECPDSDSRRYATYIPYYG